MKLTKESLEALYATRSLGELAKHLGMARSTLYYHMKKLGVERRSKSEAQNAHLKKSSHQRCGKAHTDETKSKIADGTRRFWDSSLGADQKDRLREMRRKEWQKRSKKQKKQVLHRLQSAERPAPGELSKFGSKLAEFLADRERVSTGIRLTAGHISDIILEDRKVVVELLLPIAVYGDASEKKLEARYDRLVQELQDAGYRVAIVEDKSNAVSLARCQRVYDALLKFFEDKSLQRTNIVS